MVSSCQKRKSLNFEEFAIYFKDLTKNLNDKEKAYAIYYWLAENIEYDVEGLKAGKMINMARPTYNERCEDLFGLC